MNELQGPCCGRPQNDGSIELGLALYLVKKLAESHEGTVEATSVEGEGAMFRVRLPQAPEQY